MKRPQRDQSWRGRHDDSGTRRQLLEAALVAEREALWQDLTDLVTEFSVAAHILPLARRIRLASDALGYATEIGAIPACMYRYYEAIETVWPRGLVARPPEDDPGDEAWDLPEEARYLLRLQADEMFNTNPEEP